MELQELQILPGYLGPHHPQTGRTHCDVALALEGLMGNDRKALLAAFPGKSLSDFSKLKHDAEKEHERIKRKFLRGVRCSAGGE